MSAIETHPSLEVALACPPEPSWSEAADILERRGDVRRPGEGLWTTLVTLDGTEVLSRPADNYGEGGLHLTVPIGYGFAVGQRYEVLLHEGVLSSHQKRNLIGEGAYATVVRTQFVINDRGDQVGVGLRLDHPLWL